MSHCYDNCIVFLNTCSKVYIYCDHMMSQDTILCFVATEKKKIIELIGCFFVVVGKNTYLLCASSFYLKAETFFFFFFFYENFASL